MDKKQPNTYERQQTENRLDEQFDEEIIENARKLRTLKKVQGNIYRHVVGIIKAFST